MEKWIGSPVVRLATALVSVFAVAVIGAVTFVADDALPAWLKLLGFIGALLAALGCILSFHGVYRRWMRFAVSMQTVVVTTLFGVSYLVVVPFFWILLRNSNSLHLRAPSKRPDTYWQIRQRGETGTDSYLRMG